LLLDDLVQAEFSRGRQVATSLFYQSRAALRTLFLWLGLGALTVQAFAPLCLTGGVGGSPAGVSSIILCTAHGFERIQIGADGQPLPAQGDDQKGSDCFLCVAMHGSGAFPTSARIAVEIPTKVSVAPIAVASIPAPSREFASAYVSRGPPAFL
jgi:hypothetical protein